MAQHLVDLLLLLVELLLILQALQNLVLSLQDLLLLREQLLVCGGFSSGAVQRALHWHRRSLVSVHWLHPGRGRIIGEGASACCGSGVGHVH